MDLDKQKKIRDNHIFHIQKYINAFNDVLNNAIELKDISGIEENYLVELTKRIRSEAKDIKDLIEA